MPKIQVTIVPKEVGQLWDQILQHVLNDISRSHVLIPKKSITDLIPHQYNKHLNVYQGECHQQHTPNLCGYHATFNTLCFLNLLKGGTTSYDILSGASFWQFKRRVEKFLFEIKAYNKLGEDWPWRDKDILFGDFERSYNKLCLQYFQDFEIFRNHEQFELYSYTWEFQYENLIVAEDKKRELNQLISHFKNYKNQTKPLVLSFMLAITNHWMCMLALKQGSNTQYWFFDSSNRRFLDLQPEKIQELVEQLERERIRIKKEGYSPFYKKNMAVCMRDTQISLKLIIDCLQGRSTIEEYTYNQQFNIFANALEKHWDTDRTELRHTIKDYWYNIQAFFRLPLQRTLFTQRNQERMDRLLEISHELKEESEEGKRLNILLRRYDTRIRI